MSDMIKFSSIYGFNEREPMIHFEWGEKKAALSITEARAHAIAVLETVEAAIGDAFIFEFASSKIGGDDPDQVGAAVLMEFRKWRDQRGFGGGIDMSDPRPKGEDKPSKS